MIKIPAILVGEITTIDRSLIPSDVAWIVLDPIAKEWKIYQAGDTLPE